VDSPGHPDLDGRAYEGDERGTGQDELGSVRPVLKRATGGGGRSKLKEGPNMADSRAILRGLKPVGNGLHRRFGSARQGYTL
jgi:hypothetical protein